MHYIKYNLRFIIILSCQLSFINHLGAEFQMGDVSLIDLLYTQSWQSYYKPVLHFNKQNLKPNGDQVVTVSFSYSIGRRMKYNGERGMMCQWNAFKLLILWFTTTRAGLWRSETAEECWCVCKPLIGILFGQLLPSANIQNWHLPRPLQVSWTNCFVIYHFHFLRKRAILL